ncbi:MAG TPA: histidine phosphatase family protein [Burkholderiaceae bacterium]
MGQLYLVRHGQASFGTANYDQLSPLGMEQGRILGAWFAECGLRFDHVVTGDLQRHRQTAQACLETLAPANQPSQSVDAGFNEYDHDEIMLRHRPEFADPQEIKHFLARHENGKKAFQQVFEDAMGRWMSGRHDEQYSESWPVFRQRCVTALTRLIDNGGSQRIVVFTSGGTIATLIQHVLGMTDAQVFQLNWSLVNSAVTKLMFQPGAEGKPARVSLSYLNNFSHLEKSRDGALVTYR